MPNSNEKLQIEKMQCPKCQGLNIGKSGRSRSAQQYVCKDCRRRFIDPALAKKGGRKVQGTNPQCPICGADSIKKNNKVNGKQYKCRGAISHYFIVYFTS
ncbi:MAG: IS1/IS1595 family N-terminal zinc-binding domain-containing protein [Elainellaceae cyanobacterium]